MPFAANRQVGEGGGGGGRSGGAGRGVGGVSLGQDIDFCGAATSLSTGLDDQFCALAYIYHAPCLRILATLHQVLAHRQRAKQVLRHHLYGLTALILCQ